MTACVFSPSSYPLDIAGAAAAATLFFPRRARELGCPGGRGVECSGSEGLCLLVLRNEGISSVLGVSGCVAFRLRVDGAAREDGGGASGAVIERSSEVVLQLSAAAILAEERVTLDGMSQRSIPTARDRECWGDGEDDRRR